MGLASAWSVALLGLEGRVVEVEADIGPGLPRTVMVGLPDTALYESRDRCKAAIGNSGHRWPDKLVTINLSPATLPKAGAHYDLAIVAAVLAADEVLPAAELAGTVFMGELSLDGRLRPVRGILPALLAAAQAGFRRAIVPRVQAGEAELVEGLEVFGIASLPQLIACCGTSRSRSSPEPADAGRAIDAAPTSRHASAIRRSAGRRWTWLTWSASRRPSGRSRLRRPVGITCRWWAHPGWARRCWPSGCPGLLPALGADRGARGVGHPLPRRVSPSTTD